MSQVDTLLATLDTGNDPTAAGNAEPHIIVGANRFIIVPKELTRIGVQYDHNVETVTFDCIRYWDGHDLSAMVVKINYKSADNITDSYLITDLTIDTTDASIMHFTWTISSDVTRAAGYIAFSICISDRDNPEESSIHWNSEVCNDMYVSPGIRVD